MKYLSSFPHPGLHPLARLRAWHRTLAACAAGGLRFPGSDNPSYADFANYAVIIGMTSQVSDVHVGPLRCGGSLWHTGWCRSPST